MTNPRIRFFYNGKARAGEVVNKFRSKKNVHCITVLLTSGETRRSTKTRSLAWSTLTEHMFT